jgi:hypothetical protein
MSYWKHKKEGLLCRVAALWQKPKGNDNDVKLTVGQD